MESEIVVHKLDENGRSVYQYPAEAVERGSNHVQLEAQFGREDIHTAYTTFRKGDRFVEYFYNDRWYNIFAVYDRDNGQLKGWYCNICRPARLETEAVFCEDLALDVWIRPDGATVVLDEDEFEALEITEEERRNGRSALTALLELAQNHQLPT